MMIQLIIILIAGTSNILCEQDTIPFGIYRYRFGSPFNFNYIYIRTQDTLVAKLEAQWVSIVLNVVRYTYDKKTGSIDLDPSDFPHDASKFPYVNILWSLKYNATMDEVWLTVPGTEGHIPFRRPTRLLRNPRKAPPPRTTTTRAPTTTVMPLNHEVCTSRELDKTNGRTRSSVVFFDDHLNGNLSVSSRVTIYFDRLKYIRREAFFEKTEDIIPACPSCLVFPYIDFAFTLLYDTSDKSAIMVGEGGDRTVLTAKNCYRRFHLI